MEVTLPYRLHHHQNGPLHNAIAKTRNAQWPHFAVRFRNQYTPRWQRVVRPRQQLGTDRRKFSVEMLLHLCLVDAVDARRLGSAGGQRNTSRFPEPSSVGDQFHTHISHAPAIRLPATRSSGAACDGLSTSKSDTVWDVKIVGNHKSPWPVNCAA